MVSEFAAATTDELWGEVGYRRYDYKDGWWKAPDGHWWDDGWNWVVIFSVGLFIMLLVLPFTVGKPDWFFFSPLYLALIAANGLLAVGMVVVELQSPGLGYRRRRRQLVLDELKRRGAERPEIS